MKQILLVSLLVLLAACGRSSPNEKLVKALKSIKSWTATAQMVGETWQQGSIPDIYAQQTLEKSQEEIAKETKGLTNPSLLQQLQPLQQTLQQMTEDVKQNHKIAIATSLQKLAGEQQQLDAFAASQGKQP